ncbi:MAG TPA: helix-turn-helix transcriptional regulator [Rhizomicrobium sp.]|nr:helix-turn-helix transcriptional regulator [Rhizomicrobium sp.]
MAKNSDEHTPHPLDIALGARVRLRRKELGMSQDQLARAVGITFQQVQKYEHGTNRISFSRLVEMAEALECGVVDLIGNLDKSKSSAALSRQIAFLTEPGASDLLEAYASIESPKRRRAILNLARQLANDQAEQQQQRPATKRSARA